MFLTSSCSHFGVSEPVLPSPASPPREMQSATLDASDFYPEVDLTEQGGASTVPKATELVDSDSRTSEVEGSTLEAAEPADTDSFASSSSDTCETTECYASEPTEGYEQCKWQGEANVWKQKLKRLRSTINLVETPSPTENCKGNETCKGAPQVLGGWIEPPERKKRVVGAYKYVETPGKSDVRGRPARDVRQWVRVACESAEVRGYWGV